MVGGVKATYYAVLLALVLIVGGAKVLSGQDVTDGEDVLSVQDFGQDDDPHPTAEHEHAHSRAHHDHPQPPPLLEMLPPIGLVGIVAMGVIIFEGEEPVQNSASPSASNTEATIKEAGTPVNPSQSFPPKAVEIKKVRK